MATSTIVEATALESAVRRFGALADPTRLRILAVLATAPCCACDVQAALHVAPNLLSYHLRVLREAGLIDGTRRGRWIDYRLAPGARAPVAEALDLAGMALPTRPDSPGVCEPDGARAR